MTRTIPIVLASLIGTLAPVLAEAKILYANDFDDCAFDDTWSTVWRDPNRIFHTSEQAMAGCSIQTHYPPTEDAMTRGEGAATDRNFERTRHINIRYWMMLSPDFQSSNISTKWMYGPRSTDSVGAAGPGCLLVTVGAPVPYLGCQSSLYPDGYYAVPYDRNNGYSTAPTQARGEWVCYEYEIDMGSGEGSSDGVMRLWKNDQLLGELTDLPLWRPGSGHFDNIAFYQERGIGEIWYDNLVITNGERIGCDGQPPAVDWPDTGDAPGEDPGGEEPGSEDPESPDGEDGPSETEDNPSGGLVEGAGCSASTSPGALMALAFLALARRRRSRRASGRAG